MSPLGRLGRTTAFRLATAQLVVFAVLTALLIGYVAVRTNALLTRQVDAAIEAEVEALADAYQRGGIRRLVLTVDARARRPGASLYLVADNSGRTLVGNVEDLPLGVLGLEDGERTLVPYRRLDDEESGRTYQALVRVFTLAGGFRLLIGRDVGERLEFQEVIRDAALAAVAVMLVTGLASWLLVGRSSLKRVEAMAETARGIMTGDLHRRLPVTGSGDEFDNLAGSLNAMLARIEALMTGLKEVSDNIAHDLRTPLTRLRTRLETALRTPSPEARQEAMAAALADADGLMAVFDALLRIARVEAGAPGEAREVVDAAAVVAEVAELYEPVVEEAGGRLVVDEAPGPLPVSGSRALIAQALTNLLDNAMKYGVSADGGPDVRLAAARAGDEIRLTVADRGPGIAAADRARATERFVRLDESRTRPGSGLGLSLVAAVARLHGGRLDLADADPGLSATLALPALDPLKGGSGEGIGGDRRRDGPDAG